MLDENIKNKAENLLKDNRKEIMKLAAFLTYSDNKNDLCEMVRLASTACVVEKLTDAKEDFSVDEVEAYIKEKINF
jgi:hypothetical protein